MFGPTREGSIERKKRRGNPKREAWSGRAGFEYVRNWRVEMLVPLVVEKMITMETKRLGKGRAKPARLEPQAVWIYPFGAIWTGPLRPFPFLQQISRR